MKKTVTLMLAALFAFLPFCKMLAAAGNDRNTTIRIEKYGVEFSLPKKRWEVRDLSSVNIPKEEGGKKRNVKIATAEDNKKIAYVRLFTKKAGDVSVEVWMGNRIPNIIQKFGKNGGSFEKGEKKKELNISSGQTVYIVYKDLQVGTKRKQKYVAFVYFKHNGRYYYFLVHNKKKSGRLENFIENTLVPGIKLF